MRYWDREINIIIAILTIITILFAIRVYFDIKGTGVIIKDTSPDGQYEVIISRKKHPETFSFSEDLCTIELYEIKSGKLVAYCENETGLKPMQSHTDIDFQWLDEGIYITVTGDIWYNINQGSYILAYN